MLAVIFFSGTFLLTTFVAFWLRVILGAKKTPIWKWGCVVVAAAQAFLLSVNAIEPAAVNDSVKAPDEKAKAMVVANVSELSDFQYRSGVYINPNSRGFRDRSKVAAVFWGREDFASMKWEGPKRLVIELKKNDEGKYRVMCFEPKVAEYEVEIRPPLKAPSCADASHVEEYWRNQP